MQKILQIITQEIKSHFARKSYLFMTFGFPLIVIVLIVGQQLFFSGKSKKSDDPFKDLPKEPIGYVDYSGLFDYPGLYGKYLIRYDDENSAKTDVQNGKLASVYVIPQDYIESGQIIRYSTQFDFVESDLSLMKAFLVNTMLEEDNPLLLTRLQSPITLLEYQLDQSGNPVTEIEGSGFNNFGLVYSFALALMLPTFFTAGQLTRSVIIEKENRVIEIVLSSLRPMQLMVGKVLGNGAAGFIQFLLWLLAIVVSVKITGGEVPFIGTIDMPAWVYGVAVLYFIGGYLLFAAFASGVGAISANMREGPQYALVYTLPATLPFFFITSILESPNSITAVVLSFFPLSAPLGMIERIAISSVPGWQIAASLLLLFASVVFALWFSARLFRVNTLLSGQLFDVKAIIRLLLQKEAA